MFIRARKRILKNGKQSTTYQLIESVRLGQKVKSRVVCGLGHYPDIEGAARKYRELLALYQRLLDREKNKRRYREKNHARRLVHYEKKINSFETKLKILTNLFFVVANKSRRRDKLD